MSEDQDIKSGSILKLFSWGIFISCLILSPFVLDFTLNARLIFLAITMVAMTWKIQQQSPSTFSFSLPVVTYTVFVVWNLIAIIWTINAHEAFADSAKTVIAWCVFICVFLLHQKFASILISHFAKVAAGISITLFLVFSWQLISAGNFAKESMYLVTGLNGHKNLFSSFLFLLICFLIYSRNSVSSTWKKILMVSFGLDLVIIIVLRTKAVYIGMACAAIFYVVLFLLSKRKFSRRSFVIAGIIVLLSANFFFIKVLPLAIDRSLSIAGKSGKASLLSLIDEERLQLWKKSYQLINDRPVAGTGPGNWQVWFPDATLTDIWRAEDLNFTFQRPHNDLLWILSETGYVGLNLWLIFIISLILLASYSAQTLTTNISKQQLFLLSAALVGFIIMSFFDFPKERIEHLTWFSILAAIVCSSASVVHQKGFVKIPAAAVTAILLLFSVVALLTGCFRYSGELNTRKMYGFKNGAIHAQVITSGAKAKNFVYTLDPTSVPISWYTGNAYASSGNYEKARFELEAAYKENPFNRNVLNDLGSALVFRRDTNAAIGFYSEAARISPRYDEPRLNLAAICIARKKYTEADKWLTSIMHDSERRTKYRMILDMLVSQQTAKPQ